MGATPVAVDVAVNGAHRCGSTAVARASPRWRMAGKGAATNRLQPDRAMHADRRKDKVAGRAPSFVERAQRIHVSAITLQL